MTSKLFIVCIDGKLGQVRNDHKLFRSAMTLNYSVRVGRLSRS
jgi:hypothetical protein